MEASMNKAERRRLDDGSQRTCLVDGSLVGKYTVEYLASGGMSVVYKGRWHDKEFVLKEVKASDTIEVPSLMSEKALLERLDHPGVISYHELINHDGYYYLVVEFVDGEPLSEWIDSPRVATIEEVLDWGIQLSEIFAYLHACSPPVIYRDLKPGNVLLKEGKIKLIDFGIARLHKGGKHKDTALFGSMLTASPEHYGKSETDSRSDIYTLGMTLYVLLTGGQKTQKNSFEVVPVKETRPDTPDEVNDIISKAIELEPEDRYQTMEEFRAALLVAAGRPVTQLINSHHQTMPFGPPPTADENPKTSWLPLVLAAVAVVLTLGLAFMGHKSGTPRAEVTPSEDVVAKADMPPKDMPAKDMPPKEMDKKQLPEGHFEGDGHDHSGHDHAAHANPYGGSSSGLAQANIHGDIFSAGKVDKDSVVLLGEDVGLFQVTGWQKETADQRAGTLADRLNGFYHQFCPICGKSKLEPEDIRVGRHTETKDVAVFFAHAHDNGAVFAGPLLLATVTDAQAEKAGTPPRFLASFWRDLLRDTVQVSRGLGSHHTVLGENLEEALIRSREKIKLGEVSTGNLKSVLREVTGKEAFKLRKTFLHVPDRSPTHDAFDGLNGYEPLKI